MKKFAALLGVSLAFLPAGLLAQDETSPVPSSASALDSRTASSASALDARPMGLTANTTESIATPTPPPAPLTLSQKYMYAVKDAFDPARLLLITTRAAVDQANNTPGAWGGGSSSYGIRVASRLGSDLVSETTAFGVAVLDHEERRYFRLGETSSNWARTRHAVRRAFIARSEHGGEMPAYSNFVAGLTTPFISQAWHPNGVKGMRELRSGSISLGMDAAANLWREFVPDFTKRHQMRKSANP
jgi:hypothetical protein